MSQSRKTPDFLIIGAQKAGTTSLFHYLKQHPDILTPEEKEIHFFDMRYERGIDWYQSFFSEAAASEKVTGEASPYYLFHPCVPGRVKAHLPDVKLIILLRDPVARAFSHYHHAVRMGFENVSDFFDAIALEESRLLGAEKNLAEGVIQQHFSFQHHSYISRGFYSHQIDRWLQHFPLSQMHFLQSETFFADPENALEGIFQFLGVANHEILKFDIFNQGETVMPADPMFDHIREKFQGEKQRIEDKTGLKLSWD